MADAQEPKNTEDNRDPSSTTHFGFRNVAVEEKAGLVRGVFDSVAENYDLMNDLMSAGVHRLWKTAMIDWLNPRPGQHLLDVAGGTGDISFKFMDRIDEDGQVTVLDINHNMLSVGQGRAIDQGRINGYRWVNGDAMKLPMPDKSVDAYTIAFGIRNVTDIPMALREARRVLKPGGRFMCLEFSKVTLPGLKEFYDFYSFNILPKIGGVVANDKESYQYLVESIRKFPDADQFKEMIGVAGLGQVKYRRLSGGIAALHSAWRI
ncbi:bifunctional demethylmenaquinone methyltransferase/2-methoxy-6-polyprenyl-1,4-benzoquinol methylase UbiE [Sneathiella glossodoripedis]|uniref:bifunctional demethylmenaquinone methyltransferase/2-methoxy-6-polyprenyl-1,4-benzoquinol methylase UbiE n=1 Tax=Sneathiella glossodoripedis TaxID=418853 RepID=UPI000471E4AB|nr:bifunctional demethylmenaquinone methyltransferase/2-methoxy-6-polyprenyl-1,4-benzoquinol methylase UbiE [Sneathiella glossodoripedis]